MSGSDPAGGEGPAGRAPEEDGGILGNLPRSRPAVRSPRRADPDPEPVAASAAEEEADESAGREAEIEALARAGLSLAGGAATLGLRAAGRAAAALRDAVERR